QCSLSFIDVPSTSTFYANIRCLACRGILGGYADGTFRPNNDITRGQIAKVVSNAAGFNEDPGTQIYEDVPATDAFYAWINRLSMRGHMGGYPCGTTPSEPCGAGNKPYFRPTSSATRGQLAKIVASAASITGTPTGHRYADVAEDSTFYVWIEQLSSLGVMGGYPCGTAPTEPCDDQGRPYFRPFNNVTRGQASKIVANTFLPGCVTP
ncbi:MAG TPA: S-layer homology domain-containing protein, partial [Chloroflexia bacterium]|nr:S-layer homology domain-containing protein [Chloroflexia bacterium]